MTIRWDLAAQHTGLGLITLLAACEGATHAWDGPSPSSHEVEEPSPPAGADPHADSAPVEETAQAPSQPPSDEQTAQQTLTLVRRAELREPVTRVSAALDASPILTRPCGDGYGVSGQLDASSHFVDYGSFGFLVDAYLVTALESGTVSVASRVEPVGEAYEFGYGYPLNAQQVQSGAAVPALSASLIPGMSLPDNALDDGKARMDLPVEAGVQYVISFKALVGPASVGDGWRYALGLCSEKLRVDGQLWLSADENDMVPAQPLSGLISRDNAQPGAMGALVQAIQPR